MHLPPMMGKGPSRAEPSSVERPNQLAHLPTWPVDSLALLALGTPSDEGEEDTLHPATPPPTAHLRATLFDDITADLRAATQGGTTTTTLPWDHLRSTIRHNRTPQLQQCAADPADDDSPTILHWLARKLRFEAVPEDDARFAVAQFLAELAAELDPGMLAVQDRESGSTPVHLLLGLPGVGRRCVARVVLAVCRRAAAAAAVGEGKGGGNIDVLW